MAIRWKRVAGAGLALVVMCGGAGAFMMRDFPAVQGSPLTISERIVGVETEASYAWLVRTEHGVLLIDSGLDPDGKALRAALADWGLGEDDVHTVLLTHAHADHTGGLSRFTRARILVDADDMPLIDGDFSGLGVMAQVFAAMMTPPPPPRAPEVLTRGVAFEVDGVTVQPIHVPGHTFGSTAYVLQDVLFSGDAVVPLHGGVGVLPAFIAADYDRSVRSVGLLAGLDVDVMADGHGGLTPRPADAIEAFVSARVR